MEFSQVDRRSQRRVEAAIPIRVHGLDLAGAAYDDSTTAIEVSRRGLSFLSRRDLADDTELTVVIPGRGAPRPSEEPCDFFARAAVVQSVQQTPESYRVGIRFMGATFPMYSAERL